MDVGDERVLHRLDQNFGEHLAQRVAKRATHWFGAGTHADVGVEGRSTRFPDPDSAGQQLVHDARRALRRVDFDADEVRARLDEAATELSSQPVVLLACAGGLAHDVGSKVVVAERNQRADLRVAVDAVVQTNLLERLDVPLRAQRISNSRAGHAVRLGERSQPDKAVVEGRRQQLALVHEIGISFVEQQQRVMRQGLVEMLRYRRVDIKRPPGLSGICEIQNPRRFAPCRGKQRLAIGRTVIAVRDVAGGPHTRRRDSKGGIRAAGRDVGSPGATNARTARPIKSSMPEPTAISSGRQPCFCPSASRKSSDSGSPYHESRGSSSLIAATALGDGPNALSFAQAEPARAGQARA